MTRRGESGVASGTVVRHGFLLTVIVALVVGGLTIPGLLGDLRFAQAVEEQVARLEAPGGEGLAELCVDCHGVAGEHVSEFYPRLAGQPDTYLRNQLQLFASGGRKHAIMTPVALMLGGEEIDVLATYYASLHGRTGAAPGVDPRLLEFGRMRAAALACAACHGAEFTGDGNNPRLAGQSRDYLARQLEAYRSGVRRDTDGLMVQAAAPLSDSDVEALAAFLTAY